MQLRHIGKDIWKLTNTIINIKQLKSTSVKYRVTN
jgi:hypothetical protein